MNAEILKSTDGMKWTVAEGSSIENGMVMSIATCDFKTVFPAKPSDFSTHFVEEKPNDVKYCNLPEVVFNDYVPTRSASVLNIERLASETAWIAAFGSDEYASQKGKTVAAVFAKGFALGDNGQLAIASSELAQQMQASGYIEASRNFQIFVSEATISELARTNNISIQIPFVVGETQKQGIEEITFSPQAEELLKSYQSRKLSMSSSSTEFGKIGPQTLSSLFANSNSEFPATWKGSNTTFKDFKLDPLK